MPVVYYVIGMGAIRLVDEVPPVRFAGHVVALDLCASAALTCAAMPEPSRDTIFAPSSGRPPAAIAVVDRAEWAIIGP